METQASSNNKTSAIERALAAAKARRAGKEQETGEVPDQPTGDVDREAKQRRLREERSARAAEKEKKATEKSALRAQKLAEREAAKAAKRAAREAAKANRKPTHMKKVEAARARCARMGDVARDIFDEAAAKLDVGDLEALSQHLLVQAREMRTLRATKSVAPKLGSTVRITGGDPRHVGATGEVIHAHKLRVLVAVQGVRKPICVYTGEVEPVAQSQESVAA